MKQIFKLLSITFLLLMISSCKKEGCTDADATNYNIDAKKDDGSCTYEGSVVFWYDETVATNLVTDGAVSLTYSVGGVLAGSQAANIYWTGAPECGQNSSITYTYNLGGVKTNALTYSIKDQTDWEYWSGLVNIDANTCKSVQLIW
jgi:hypothetical protein